MFFWGKCKWKECVLGGQLVEFGLESVLSVHDDAKILHAVRIVRAIRTCNLFAKMVLSPHPLSKKLKYLIIHYFVYTTTLKFYTQFA